MISVVWHPMSMGLTILAFAGLALTVWDLLSKSEVDDIPVYSICNGLDPGSFLWYLYGCFLMAVAAKLRGKR